MRFSHPIDFVDLKLLASRYPAFLAVPDRWVSWLVGGVLSGSG